jgi:Arc/MetJ-type ribon-helix-helix transcriptional regulator
MKVSVSLPDDDVAFLDSFAKSEGFPSRSAALQEAIRTLRSLAIAAQLGDAYEEAWQEWFDSGDEALWATTSADGLSK